MKILYLTEAELFKQKKKLHPQCINNMGDGYSQYMDESTRMEILKKVKAQCQKVLGVHASSYDTDKALELIEEADRLLQINYKKFAIEDPGAAIVESEEEEAPV